MEILDKIIKKYQDGTILNIFVIPGSCNTIFPAEINMWRKCIEIRVKSSAVKNKANKDVIKTIANFFEKSKDDVLILTGNKNPKKTVYIKGITVDFVSNRLRESLHGL